MKYSPLGNTGLYVSQLTLGAMTFDNEDGMGAHQRAHAASVALYRIEAQCHDIGQVAQGHPLCLNQTNRPAIHSPTAATAHSRWIGTAAAVSFLTPESDV